MGRMVETVYGPMPGCPDCDVVSLSGTHICEHGVTPSPMVEVTLSLVFSICRVCHGAGWIGEKRAPYRCPCCDGKGRVETD